MKTNNKELSQNEESAIGKFNSADELLSAYNALEREFTKRCQLIKQLQAQIANAPSAQADIDKDGEPDIENAPEERSEAEKAIEKACESGEANQDEKACVKEAQSSFVEPQSEVAAAIVVAAPTASAPIDDGGVDSGYDIVGAVAERAAEIADVLSDIPEIMDACIARYKHKLIEARAFGGASPSGSAVIAPVRRPRTLYEAKQLADELLGGNR
ncbi:MAG: hypothetical protein J1G01_00180 [Clostridiales bacterium]|nr:hypothetical protein [Clostridiales bacterium]